MKVIDENRRMLLTMTSYIIGFAVLIPSLLISSFLESDVPLFIGFLFLIGIQLVTGYSPLTHFARLTHREEKPKVYWSTIFFQITLLIFITLYSLELF
tara:strand:+ start:1813 stop:2106 length:294 start_codon:yes stop_codon:yes gene_type:complete